MESTKCHYRQENPSHVGWAVTPPVAQHPGLAEKVYPTASVQSRRANIVLMASTFCTLLPLVNTTSRLSTTLMKRFFPEFTGAGFFNRAVKGGGYEFKTDPRCAQVLSRFGGVFQENCTRRPEPEVQELQDLLRRRRQLVEKGPGIGAKWTRWSGRCRNHKPPHRLASEEITNLDREYHELLRNNADGLQTVSIPMAPTTPG